MVKRKLRVAVPLVALAILACLLTQQYAVDGDGVPVRAIGVADLRAHSESSLVYPGAQMLSAQANAQSGSTLLGIEVGTIVPAQARATYQSPAHETTVMAWYERWLRSHLWSPARGCDTAGAGGIPFDRCILFDRGGRERYSLLFTAFAQGTEISVTFSIQPFTITGLG